MNELIYITSHSPVKERGVIDNCCLIRCVNRGEYLAGTSSRANEFIILDRHSYDPIINTKLFALGLMKKIVHGGCDRLNVYKSGDNDCIGYFARPSIWGYPLCFFADSHRYRLKFFSGRLELPSLGLHGVKFKRFETVAEIDGHVSEINFLRLLSIVTYWWQILWRFSRSV